MAQEMKSDVMENIQVRSSERCWGACDSIVRTRTHTQAYLATQAQLQLMEETTPSKILRSRDGQFLSL